MEQLSFPSDLRFALVARPGSLLLSVPRGLLRIQIRPWNAERGTARWNLERRAERRTAEPCRQCPDSYLGCHRTVQRNKKWR